MKFPLLETSRRVILMCVVQALLLACSKGDGGVGVGGTGTVAPGESAVTTTGPITGFGSVIVSGSKFDDIGAVVTSDSNTVHLGDLRLGMTVTVTGVLAADGLSARANQIHVFSEVTGPVLAASAGTASLDVLGVAVVTDVNTVIEGVAALADVRPGDLVRVYGLRNTSSNQIRATRLEIEVKNATASTSDVSLSGSVQNLNASTSSFTINGIQVSYAGITPAGTLLDGSLVTVAGIVANGTTLVQARTVIVASAESQSEGQIREIEGTVSAYVSRASFKINGTAADASLTSLSSAQVARLANGVSCHAKGKVSAGIIIVQELECESSGDSRSYEVSGTVTSFTSASNFLVRNQVIDATSASFSKGKLSDLKLGKKVEAKGPVVGSVLKASTIAVE